MKYLFLILALFGTRAFAQRPAVPETADGYHFAEWLGTTHLANYTEWWYFNVYDSTNNVKAIFTYFITNPAGLTGGLYPVGISEMSAVAYTANSVVTETDIYPVAAFSAAYNRADVRIGKNTVTVIDPEAYEISGASRDGRMVWKLNYRRAAPSWYAANRISVAPESWELMSWLLYMPSASVSGTLTVDGIVYNVSAPGYHDHNWGEWDLTGVPWNWAQYSQPGLTFDLGDFPNKPGGIASVEWNGQRYVFQSGQYTLTHTVWAFDAAHGVYYPTQSVFQADNGTAQVNLNMLVQMTDPLTAPLPPGVPNAIIYEQTVAYSGSVTVNGLSTDIAGNGFKEYTAVTQ
jgi:hypothetical protein